MKWNNDELKEGTNPLICYLNELLIKENIDFSLVLREIQTFLINLSEKDLKKVSLFLAEEPIWELWKCIEVAKLVQELLYFKFVENFQTTSWSIVMEYTNRINGALGDELNPFNSMNDILIDSSPENPEQHLVISKFKNLIDSVSEFNILNSFYSKIISSADTTYTLKWRPVDLLDDLKLEMLSVLLAKMADILDEEKSKSSIFTLTQNTVDNTIRIH